MTFNRYLIKFGRLRTGASRKHGKAPHKPILLLSIIELIDQGDITENKIYITPELVASFKKIWGALVTSNIWQPRFYLPFYHLNGDKFWHLHVLPGAEIALTTSHSVKSLAALRATVEYASFDDELFSYLINENTRAQLKGRLLKVYFPDVHYEVDSIIGQVKQYIQQLELQMLEEKAATNVKPYEIEEDEEEQAVRNGLFKRKIPEYYHFTCCISGLRVDSTKAVSMVDACHIIPWSKTQDDSVKNGFTLCPNLHRAFDRGLIGVDDGYKVIVSDDFLETESDYSIRKFSGKGLILPKSKSLWPGQDNFREHRKLHNIKR